MTDERREYTELEIEHSMPERDERRDVAERLAEAEGHIRLATEGLQLDSTRTAEIRNALDDLHEAAALLASEPAGREPDAWIEAYEVERLMERRTALTVGLFCEDQYRSVLAVREGHPKVPVYFGIPSDSPAEREKYGVEHFPFPHAPNLTFPCVICGGRTGHSDNCTRK